MDCCDGEGVCIVCGVGTIPERPLPEAMVGARVLVFDLYNGAPASARVYTLREVRAEWWSTEARRFAWRTSGGFPSMDPGQPARWTWMPSVRP